MTDTTLSNDTPPPEKVRFVESHSPALDSGGYNITIEQSIKTTEDETFETPVLEFSVAGPRFALAPGDVQAVFPPPGSRGDHSNVLPHVILSRSTLPWERLANSTEAAPELPWLALLLFDGAEIDTADDANSQVPDPTIKTLGDLKNSRDAGLQFPEIDPESDHHDLSQKVTVIDVPADLLMDIAPTRADLPFLAHVRQGTVADHAIAQAIVVCNRLPRPGVMSTAHLVSIEGRYGDHGFDGSRTGGDVRLVSLKSWRFACEREDHSFAGLLKNLKIDVLRLPDRPDGGAPGPNGKSPNDYLGGGFVPLSHSMRQGERTCSWYHGPLRPVEDAVPGGQTLPARGADELVRFDPTYALFDVSYGAAWELGRLLSLGSKSVSSALYNWKCARRQSARQAGQVQDHPHLPDQPEQGAAEFPDALRTWFKDLGRLRGVPFNYLAPDEAMLPTESIRFFQVDRFWVNCLLDGAFSIGRVTPYDYEINGAGAPLDEPSPVAEPNVSGILMRSDVVAGWPDLIVDAYEDLLGDEDAAPTTSLELLRMERLSKNVLICLFDGDFQTIDIHRSAEGVHFGFDRPGGESTDYTKVKRDSQGNLMSSPESRTDIVWANSTDRVVDVVNLAGNLSAPNSAEFALQMIEGVSKVRFKRASPEASE